MGKPKKPTPLASCSLELAVTPEEAGALAEMFTHEITQDGDEIARFLLLCHALTYTRDLSARENMLSAIEQKLMPFVNGIDELLHAEMGAHLAALREMSKGGAK